MYLKIKLTVLGIVFSLGLIAQGKIYIVPQIDCKVSAFKGVDSVNSNQSLIKTKPFTRKDFLVGIKLTYTNKSLALSAGYEESVYSSGFFHNESNSNPTRVDSKETVSEGDCKSFFIEGRYELLDFNIKMLKWLSRNPNKPYLVVSKFAPVVGVEYRKMGRNFINDFVESNSVIGTSQGDIPGTRYYHAYKNTQLSIRAGVDWIFFNESKRRFILTFMYHFAFKDAGYFRYHFYKPGVADFYYQTTTRGNGFSIKAGIPIKVFENKKKKVK